MRQKGDCEIVSYVHLISLQNHELAFQDTTFLVLLVEIDILAVRSRAVILKCGHACHIISYLDEKMERERERERESFSGKLLICRKQQQQK